MLEADGDLRGALAEREEWLRLGPGDPTAKNDVAWSLATGSERAPLRYRRSEAFRDVGLQADAEAALAEARAAAGATPSPELAAEEARIRARLEAQDRRHATGSEPTPRTSLP